MPPLPENVAKRVARRPGKPAPRLGSPNPRSARLPEWNLNDLYSGLDDPAIKRDLDRADADCVAFEEAYKGKLAAMAARRTAARRSPRRCGATRRSTI